MKATKALEIIDCSTCKKGQDFVSSLSILQNSFPTRKGKRWIVLGEFPCRGVPKKELLKTIMQTGVSLVFSMNMHQPLLEKLPKEFIGGFYSTQSSLLSAIIPMISPGDVVLVAGKTEQVMPALTNYEETESLYKEREQRIKNSKKRSKETLSIIKKEHETVEINLAGDTSHGENYQKKLKINYLEERGYDSFFQPFKEILSKADLCIINLETPLTKLKSHPEGHKKKWLHWSDPERASNCFLNHNISVLSLANNHTFDCGVEGIEETFQTLDNKGIRFFGAGYDDEQAKTPLRVDVTLGDRKIPIAFIAAEGPPSNQTSKQEAQANKIDILAIKKSVQTLRDQNPDTFVICIPHWGENYKWKSIEQQMVGSALLSVGVDLIIGHGAHMIQEIERVEDHWIIYSLGNFVFNSLGRYQKLDAPPFSFIARLMIFLENNQPFMKVRLYPILTDNRKTEFHQQFVSDDDFATIYSILEKKCQSFTHLTHPLETGKDISYYFELPKIPMIKDKKEPKKEFVGMICRMDPGKDYNLNNKKFKFRGYAIHDALTNTPYELFMYSPLFVDPKYNITSGIYFKGNTLQKKTTLVPEVNHDWNIGKPLFVNKKPLLKFKGYHAYRRKHNNRIYPPVPFTTFAKDKLATFQELVKTDFFCLPETELFNNNVEQLTAFLEKFPKVFLKPQFGFMGEEILVLLRDENGVHLRRYTKKKMTNSFYATIDSLLSSILPFLQKKSFLIQEGIDVATYNDSVFDVRSIIIFDGKEWQNICYARLGKSKSDLSNVAQGGMEWDAFEVLCHCFSEKKAKSILSEIQDKSRQLAKYLNQIFQKEILEVGFDILITQKQQLFLAEINTKPGTAGDPYLFHDFFQRTEEEEKVYQTYTKPHGMYIADFLVRKMTELKERKRGWFQHLLGKKSPPIDLLESFAHYLQKQVPFPSEIKQDQELRLLFVTARDNSGCTRICFGSGKGIVSAFEKAIPDFKDKFLWENVLKLDLVNHVVDLGEISFDEQIPYDRSLYGIAFSYEISLAFLAEEVVAWNLVKKRQKIQLDNIQKYIEAKKTYAELPEKNEKAAIYQFRCQSIVLAKEQLVPLYRGHRTYHSVNKETVLEALQNGVSHLIRAADREGRLPMRTFPKKNDSEGDDDQIKIASLVTSCSQLFALTQDEKLLPFLKTQVNRLEETTPTNWTALLSFSKHVNKTDVKEKLALFEEHFSSSTKTDTTLLLPFCEMMLKTHEKFWLDKAKKIVKKRMIKNRSLKSSLPLIQGLQLYYPMEPNKQTIDFLNHMINKELQNICQVSPYADWIGGYGVPPTTLATAQILELLTLSYQVLNEESLLPYINKSALFLLENQIHPELAQYFQNPDKTVYGFKKGPDDYLIHLDTIHHALRALTMLSTII